MELRTYVILNSAKKYASTVPSKSTLRPKPKMNAKKYTGYCQKPLKKPTLHRTNTKVTRRNKRN